ncbi:hypothetical protein BHK98_00240 [Hornefia porci]|uniref:Uncharacterized protein n=2 Tax=Hornefia porci TaxID=2652292 RepID=A0A1Q9JEL1_9FIRM|nr:hypothetical protein BHK98_00240 [Hornefia porci]
MAFLDTLRDAAQQMGDRASDALETSKLKGKINSEKKEINIEMQKIGKIFFDKIKSGEIESDEDLKNIIEKIDAHNQTIDELKESLAALTSED